MDKLKFPVRNDSFLTGKNIIPTGKMFFPMEIMLQPREMDNCLQEIYNFQRELYNFCGNWIITSGNFPFAVEKMIFPVGDELFLIGNYPFPMIEDASLMGKDFFLSDINLRLQEIIKFQWEIIHCPWKAENFHREICWRHGKWTCGTEIEFFPVGKEVWRTGNYMK